MRIGIVTTWQERGAAYVSRQYRDALKDGHEVFIYARGGEYYNIGDKNWDDGTVTWGKKIPIHMPLAVDLIDFKKWLLKNKLEIVFFNEQQWWDPVILCTQLGIKTGAYIDYYTKETAPFFSLYDFVICNTQRHFEAFKWHRQARYIPWGTNLDLFKPFSPNLVAPDIITFFHSAGFSPERKGTDLLIKAFTDIIGPARLIIHTQVDLGKFYPELEETIKKLINNGRLKIFQKTVAAPGLYHLGDIYVYPSRLDGIGLSLPEALACGLPVVASDNQPMNEFINEKNGWLIKINKLITRQDDYYWPMCEPDMNNLKSILQNLANQPNNILNFKKNAREYAEKKLNWFSHNLELQELFKNFIVIPLTEKKDILEKVIKYEKKRSNWQTKLYRACPWLFEPFKWLWPLIKLGYIKK